MPPEKPVLHGDNGASLKATTVLAMINGLGITASRSWPRVSDDNAVVESLFRTTKYRSEFQSRRFADLEQAHQWTIGFVHWGNHDHRHRHPLSQPGSATRGPASGVRGGSGAQHAPLVPRYSEPAAYRGGHV
jgi:hypothetical protein